MHAKFDIKCINFRCILQSVETHRRDTLVPVLVFSSQQYVTALTFVFRNWVVLVISYVSQGRRKH